MDRVKVEKSKLLETLKKNRDEHRATFLKAQEIYRDTVIEALEKRLEQARNGQLLRIGVSLPEPVDYTNEYDAAIAMIEWEVDDTIELETHVFRQFVLDDWSWKRTFLANSVAYTTGSVRAE